MNSGEANGSEVHHAVLTVRAQTTSIPTWIERRVHFREPITNRDSSSSDFTRTKTAVQVLQVIPKNTVIYTSCDPAIVDDAARDLEGRHMGSAMLLLRYVNDPVYYRHPHQRR